MTFIKFHTTQIIRTEENNGHDYDQQTMHSRWDVFLTKLFQQKPTVAELSKEEFISYIAISQGNSVRRMG